MSDGVADLEARAAQRFDDLVFMEDSLEARLAATTLAEEQLADLQKRLKVCFRYSSSQLQPTLSAWPDIAVSCPV